MFEVSMEDLKRVLKDFYNLTKFKIVLYDADRTILYSYPETMCSFCTAVRTHPVLTAKCLASDNAGFDICDRTGKPYIYECFMSAVEAIAPIYAGEICVGYLMFGQILGTDREKVRRKAEEISRVYGVHITEDMLSEMTSADEKYIASAVNMMTMCANYLYTTEIIRNDPNLLVSRLREYVEAHLDGDISVPSVCRHFYISRTKLYRLCAENFGMGLSDYVRARRIRQAKKLLRTTEEPVSSVAARVGINDVNYFIRIFKKAEGMTPLRYRKRIKAE